MRRFTDAEGRIWEVVVGRESWGVFVALFIPVEGDDVVRQASLLSSAYEQATAEIDVLDESELRELLARSVPNPLGF